MLAKDTEDALTIIVTSGETATCEGARDGELDWAASRESQL